jgi:uncharacterized protein YigE (DUF2233 family)
MTKNKHNWLFLILLCFVSNLAAQVQEFNNFTYKSAKYDIVDFEVNEHFSKSFSIFTSNKNITEKKLFDSLSKNSKFFACSAALVDTSCSFLGLYVDKGNIITPINQNAGTGNFYLMPNGYVWVDTIAAGITSSMNYDLNKKYKYAVQSGPLLIDNGTINTNFNISSTNRNIRLGVGTYSKQGVIHLVFIISKTPVTFYDISSLFLDKFKCSSALSLDGGNQIAFHAPNSSDVFSTKKFPCNYIVIKLK